MDPDHFDEFVKNAIELRQHIASQEKEVAILPEFSAKLVETNLVSST